MKIFFVVLRVWIPWLSWWIWTSVIIWSRRCRGWVNCRSCLIFSWSVIKLVWTVCRTWWVCCSVRVWVVWTFLTIRFRSSSFCLRFWWRCPIWLLCICRTMSLPRRFLITERLLSLRYPILSILMISRCLRMKKGLRRPGREEDWRRRGRRGRDTGKKKKRSKGGSMSSLGKWLKELGKKGVNKGKKHNPAKARVRWDLVARVFRLIILQLRATKTVRKVLSSSNLMFRESQVRRKKAFHRITVNVLRVSTVSLRNRLFRVTIWTN